MIFAPLIRTMAPRSWRPLDSALNHLEQYDAVIFASANAAAFVFARIKKIFKTRPPAPAIVAAVGPSTAKALCAGGWNCTFVADDNRAAGLARELRLPRGTRVLIPRAAGGLDVLPQALKKAGLHVTTPTAYRTVADARGRRVLGRALASGVDAVCFASGSAVAALGGRGLKGAAAIAIGPTTAAALKKAGLPPAATALKPDAESFAKSVEDALRNRP